MKKYLYLIACLSIILGCENNGQKKNTTLNFGTVIIKSPDLIDSLRGYYKHNIAKEKSGVITVDFRFENDTSIFFVSSIIDKGSVMNNPPSYYSIIDEFPVLFYTGIEKNLTFDSSYIVNLYKHIDPLLEEYIEEADGRVIQIPPNYNPVVWKIEMTSRKIVKTEIIN